LAGEGARGEGLGPYSEGVVAAGAEWRIPAETKRRKQAYESNGVTASNSRRRDVVRGGARKVRRRMKNDDYTERERKTGGRTQRRLPGGNLRAPCTVRSLALRSCRPDRGRKGIDDDRSVGTKGTSSGKEIGG